MPNDNPEERKAMLAAIIESSDDAIMSKNLDSRITSWNKAAERMFGYNETEMIGESIYKLIPQERKDEELMILANLRQGNRIDHFETIRLDKNGRPIEVSLSISPIRDKSGVVVGASKIARDITARKQYERRMALIYEVGQFLSAHLDLDDILQKVTDVTTKLSGAAFGAFFYNKADAKGESYMLYALSGAPREAFDKFGMPRNTAVFKHTFDGVGIVRSDDITADPRYGKNYPHNGMPAGHLPVVSYLAVPVISNTGAVIGGLFFGHPDKAMFTEEHEKLVMSISSQAAIALDNAKLYQDIKSVNQNKDQFISFASHELKTPLTTLKGYLQLGQDGVIPALDALERIKKQIARIEGIVSDLLDISKIQAGRLDLNFKLSSLHEMIKESIESVDPSSHYIEVEKPESDISLFIDRRKISQVIVNIITNAIKYSDPGTTIRMTTSVIGDQVLITVEDQGIGIPKEDLNKIFNLYYRVSTNGKSQAAGLGIGLYISKEIVEGHLGKIWAENNDGKGSRFCIQFPIGNPKLFDGEG